MKLPAKKLMIEKAIDGKTYPGHLSTYLGPSALGEECARKVWYKFRNAAYPAPITARQKRLFGRGDREEPIVVKDLKDAGVEVLTQQEKVVYLDGHGMGFSDGRIRNLPDAPKTEHLLEIKTANDRNFREIAMKKIKKAKPEYYVQVQLYMHLFGLTRTLMVVVNKNTDERHYERIDYDKGAAEDIVNSPLPPTKTDSYKCRWCDYEDICQGHTPMRKGCRTCQHVEPQSGGAWFCRKKERNVKREKQLKGCKKYVAVPAA
jgi:CRISPR/Cas system-associated exonuclease Cas4 (RecB family)